MAEAPTCLLSKSMESAQRTNLHLEDREVARFASRVDGAEGDIRDRAAAAGDVHWQRHLCDLRARTLTSLNSACTSRVRCRLIGIEAYTVPYHHTNLLVMRGSRLWLGAERRGL